MKILIVDDNANMRRALKSLLADGDTEFVECEDGAGYREECVFCLQKSVYFSTQ